MRVCPCSRYNAIYCIIRIIIIHTYYNNIIAHARLSLHSAQVIYYYYYCTFVPTVISKPFATTTTTTTVFVNARHKDIAYYYIQWYSYIMYVRRSWTCCSYRVLKHSVSQAFPPAADHPL